MVFSVHQDNLALPVFQLVVFLDLLFLYVLDRMNKT